MKIFLDDLRHPPSAEWTECRVPLDFMQAVWQGIGKITEVSFDHDLGDVEDKGQEGFKEMTGYDCLAWLVQTHKLGGFKMPILKVHSANPIGSDRMERLIAEVDSQRPPEPEAGALRTYYCLEKCYHSSEGGKFGVLMFDNKKEANKRYKDFKAEDRSGYPSGSYTNYGPPFEITSYEVVKNCTSIKLEDFKDRFSGWKGQLGKTR